MAFCYKVRGPILTRSQTFFLININFVKLANCTQLLKPMSFFLFAKLEVGILFEAMALFFLKI